MVIGSQKVGELIMEFSFWSAIKSNRVPLTCVRHAALPPSNCYLKPCKVSAVPDVSGIQFLLDKKVRWMTYQVVQCNSNRVPLTCVRQPEAAPESKRLRPPKCYIKLRKVQVNDTPLSLGTCQRFEFLMYQVSNFYLLKRYDGWLAKL